LVSVVVDLGIAAMTTMLSRGSQIHQAALVHNVNPYDPEVQQRVQQLTHAMPGAAGAEQAYGIIYGMVARQAMVLSYIDNFRMLAFLCVLGVPAVFLFKRVRAKRGPGGDALSLIRVSLAIQQLVVQTSGC
jgi:DHA2 family multidrug resistance protein